jgi:RimJ/RimL family protein N-acetyltransferase
MHQPVLETPRLLLRPFVLADAPAVQRLAGAPEVAEMTMTIPFPYPDGLAEQWIRTHPEHFAKGDAATWAITLRDTSDLIGSISLVIERRNERAEMGYWLGVPYWNQGYMTEAAAAVLESGFTTLELHRIYASHFTRNPASGRVMQKIGMRYEGCRRGHVRRGARWEDLAVYGILRDDWQAP